MFSNEIRYKYNKLLKKWVVWVLEVEKKSVQLEGKTIFIENNDDFGTKKLTLFV